MVNSSMRNSLARRNYKERSQPLNRQSRGLLEKHKDYVIRARDYKSKQARLQKLREKAAFKNKDEFYWGMIKGRTKDGVAQGDRGHEALNVDVVKILKSQDVGYVRLQIAKDEKLVRKLREELEVTAPVAGPSSEEWGAAAELAEVEKMAEMGIILRPRAEASISASQARKGKGRAVSTGRIVFVDDQAQLHTQSEAESAGSLETEVTDDEGDDLGWTDQEAVRPSRPPSQARAEESALEDEARVSVCPPDPVTRLKPEQQTRLDLLTTLSAVLGRLKMLRQAESKLLMTKGLMGKGAARKIRGNDYVDDSSAPEDKNGDRKSFQSRLFKWKLERRR